MSGTRTILIDFIPLVFCPLHSVSYIITNILRFRAAPMAIPVFKGIMSRQRCNVPLYRVPASSRYKYEPNAKPISLEIHFAHSEIKLNHVTT